MRVALVLLAAAACEPAVPVQLPPVHASFDEGVTLPSPRRPVPEVIPLLLPPKLDDAAAWFAELAPAGRATVQRICTIRKEYPCAGLGPPELEQHGIDTLFAKLDVPGWQVDAYCIQAAGVHVCNTPLVLAFDGTVAFRDDGKTFAFEPGVPVAGEWPTAATPWIARDVDGDHAITSGAELFGDHTVAGAHDGFAALATLDANHDGRIDRDDPEFASLLLWADANGDRRSSPDELTPLAGVVRAIELAPSYDAVRCDRGHCEGGRSVVILRDGRRAAAIDVYLR